jgi:Recombinase
MPHKERIREALTNLPTLEYFQQRIQLGWRPVVVEWEREIHPDTGEPQPFTEEIPYGLRVSEDCLGLVENPYEREIITMAIDMVVEDCPLSRVAAELNQRGYQTRAGHPWTPSDLFSLLPRMIQVGPRLFSSEEWTSRRQRMPRVV